MILFTITVCLNTFHLSWPSKLVCGGVVGVVGLYTNVSDQEKGQNHMKIENIQYFDEIVDIFDKCIDNDSMFEYF